MKQKKMDKETRIRKAQERTDELFPGKDLNDMYEMYLEFGKKRKGKMGTKRIVRTEIGEGCAMRERMFPWKCWSS